MKENREPRNRPSTLWSTNLQQSRKECPMKERQSLQQMVLGKLDSHMQKNESGPFPYTTHKNRLKMDERSQCETGIIKILQGNTGNNLFNLSCSNFFLGTWPKARDKKELLGLHQDQKLLHSKGNSQQNQKKTDRMGEDIHK